MVGRVGGEGGEAAMRPCSFRRPSSAARAPVARWLLSSLAAPPLEGPAKGRTKPHSREDGPAADDVGRDAQPREGPAGEEAPCCSQLPVEQPLAPQPLSPRRLGRRGKARAARRTPPPAAAAIAASVRTGPADQSASRWQPASAEPAGREGRLCVGRRQAGQGERPQPAPPNPAGDLRTELLARALPALSAPVERAHVHASQLSSFPLAPPPPPAQAEVSSLRAVKTPQKRFRPIRRNETS